VIEHLNVQGKQDPKGGFIETIVSKQNFNPSYWGIWHIKNCKTRIGLKKLWPP